MTTGDCHAAGQGPCIAACCPLTGRNAPASCPDVIHDPCLWAGGKAVARTPGQPDPKLVVGQWREPAEGIAQANAAERGTWHLGIPPVGLDPDMPIELHPDAMWMLPDDTSLEDAYALLHAAAVRIWRECLDARERWANNTEHPGAVARAVAYQYVAGQIQRAIEGATAIHQPKEHP